MKKTFYLFAFAAMCLASSAQATLKFMTYLISWDNATWSDALANFQNPSGGTTDPFSGVVVVPFVAAYEVQGSTPPTDGNPLGLNFTDPNANLATVVSTVHNGGGEVYLSFGGATEFATPNTTTYTYWISQTTGWGSNYADLATSIGSIVATYHLDGVDLDVEDVVADWETFADQIYDFITALRSNSNMSGKAVTLTLPGEAWNSWQYVAQKCYSIVDAINMMEYNIGIGSNQTIETQIEGDLATYTDSPSVSPPPNNAPGWGLPKDKIMIGLGCAGSDVPPAQAPTVAQAESLTQFANTNGYYGIALWDLISDATNSDAYAYEKGIRNNLDATGSSTSRSTLRKPLHRWRWDSRLPEPTRRTSY